MTYKGMRLSELNGKWVAFFPDTNIYIFLIEIFADWTTYIDTYGVQKANDDVWFSSKDELTKLIDKLYLSSPEYFI